MENTNRPSSRINSVGLTHPKIKQHISLSIYNVLWNWFRDGIEKIIVDTQRYWKKANWNLPKGCSSVALARFSAREKLLMRWHKRKRIVKAIEFWICISWSGGYCPQSPRIYQVLFSVERGIKTWRCDMSRYFEHEETSMWGQLTEFRTWMKQARSFLFFWGLKSFFTKRSESS